VRSVCHRACGPALRAGFVAIITIHSLATMAVTQNNPFIYFRF
jgi:hypothetical protein